MQPRSLKQNRAGSQSSLLAQIPAAHSPVEATLTPAAAALHALEYVDPSQPQTGSYSRVHTVGIVSQVPAPEQPERSAQYEPPSQSAFCSQPHSPGYATFWPAASALHRFE